ncbi:MAG: lycopene cyclase domain-containing protein [Ferruginibacter sp.]|nr:lycopene cyclase domain-containing protein [Ferruginibacter sp.]
MKPNYTYFLILAVSFAGPFFLSFDKKVAFYKKWKFVFAAMILPAIFYIIWDSIFATKGVWYFNAEKVIANTYIYNLPLEEILFFFIVPYCCLFVYECILCYFPKLQSNKKADTILLLLGALLLMVGIFTLKLYYTAYTSFFTATFIFFIFLFRKYFSSFNSTAFLVSYVIILIPFLVVNGFLTAIPVITYNDNQNLATRIFTIPVEDIFYGLLLVLMNVVIYEKLQTKKME